MTKQQEEMSRKLNSYLPFVVAELHSRPAHVNIRGAGMNVLDVNILTPDMVSEAYRFAEAVCFILNDYPNLLRRCYLSENTVRHIADQFEGMRAHYGYEIHRLENKVSALEKGRPMESAPRDGTRILVRDKNGYVHNVRLSEERTWKNGNLDETDLERWWPMVGGV